MRAYQKDFSMINVVTSAFNAANRAVHAMKTRLACLSLAGAMSVTTAAQAEIVEYEFTLDDGKFGLAIVDLDLSNDYAGNGEWNLNPDVANLGYGGIEMFGISLSNGEIYINDGLI